METLKQMNVDNRNEFLFQELQKLYDYFGNKQEEPEQLLRQVNLLSEELETYTRLTTEQFTDAMRVGRRNANDVFKPSIKLIMQWVSNHMTSIAKYEKNQDTITPKIEITEQQRKAWIISAFRRYNELEKDMSKFFDGGGVIYNSLFNFGYFEPLTENQKNWCIDQAERTKIFDIAQLLNPNKNKKDFESNYIAKSYGCKIIFDECETEQNLRLMIDFDLPVDEDHSIAVSQYTKKN
jgi:hypothetical protein